MKPFASGALKYLTRAAVIGALYAALTILLMPISFGALQFRVSEAMCVLPLFFPEAVPGLFVGCIVANFFTPNIPILDVIFGGTATLLSALLTMKMAKLPRLPRCLLAPLPPVILNGLLVGLVITLSLTELSGGWLTVFTLNALSVAAGEAVVCYGLGLPLILVMQRVQNNLNNHTDLNN